MPEPLDILMGMPPAELLALEQMGGTPSLPPDAIDRALRLQGYRTGRPTPPPAPDYSALAGLIAPQVGVATSPPDQPNLSAGDLSAYKRKDPVTWQNLKSMGLSDVEAAGRIAENHGMDPPVGYEGAPPQANFGQAGEDVILALRNAGHYLATGESGYFTRGAGQPQPPVGTPGSAMPGSDPALPGAAPAAASGPGLMALIQQRMREEAVRAGAAGAPPGAAPPAGAPSAAGIPLPPAMPGAGPAAPAGPPGTAPDPIATGAAAAQQAAAASGAQQAQTADPLAGLPEPLRSALAEYQSIAKELKQQDENAKWMALAKAGFAMAGSRNPSFFGALGEGGMAGLQAYEQQQAAEAASRLQGVGMDMEVAKLLAQRDQDAATAEQKAEEAALNRELVMARIGSLNRGNRGGGGGAGGAKPITQYQYAGMVQREYDNLLNSPLGMRPEYRQNPELLREMAVENVNSYLATTGGAAAGGGSGGTSLQAVAGAAPEDLGAPDQYNEGDVVQSENGSMWVVMDGQYQPYEQ